MQKQRVFQNGVSEHRLHKWDTQSRSYLIEGEWIFSVLRDDKCKNIYTLANNPGACFHSSGTREHSGCGCKCKHRLIRLVNHSLWHTDNEMLSSHRRWGGVYICWWRTRLWCSMWHNIQLSDAANGVEKMHGGKEASDQRVCLLIHVWNEPDMPHIAAVFKQPPTDHQVQPLQTALLFRTLICKKKPCNG